MRKIHYKKWYSSIYPQLVVYGGRIIAFTKKNAVQIDLNSKKLVDYNFRNLDLKDILSMSDRYNITVNRYTSSGSGGDTFMYGAYAADAGGYGGGDSRWRRWRWRWWLKFIFNSQTKQSKIIFYWV